MAIKVENGERSFRKPACNEYCYINKEFCPLSNLPIGESGKTKTLNIIVKRWTDIEENTTYQADYSKKPGPSSQLPPATPSNPNPQPPDLEPTGDIPDYDEKMKNETSQFTPFSCWGDGSGFERDIMPENLVGPSGSMEILYDLNYYPINTSALQLSDWNTWIDKFHIDGRFGQVSDLNAETTLFPNVDDPWMFTEYIFKGKDSGELIVEPPLYDENTLELKNVDKEYTSSMEDTGKYDEYVSVTYDEDKSKKFVKSYREVCNWDVLNTNEERRGDTNFSVKDAGGRLYRVDIPVQSVKWGEHGNIPPNTVNMGAPADWMDATKTAARIKPTYVAHIGVPFYASTHGVVYWHDRDAWIDAIGTLTKKEFNNRPYYSYEVKESEEGGVKQNAPKAIVANIAAGQNGARLVNTYLPTGSISHGGCQFLSSQKDVSGGGRCWCSAMDPLLDVDPELEVLKTHFDFDKCSTENKNCPKFVAGAEYPILADYESNAYNMAQYNEQVLGIYSGSDADHRLWADNLLDNSTGLPTADMFIAMGIGMAGRMGREDIYNPTEVAVWYEAKFEVVYESDNPVQLKGNMNDANGFGKGVSVRRGTGKMALDTYENSNAFRGDTTFFGDWDQMSFSRWFDSPMFCAKAAYCNDVCGLAMQAGFQAGIRAGSSEGACRYYRSSNTKGASSHIGCPTTCVQKRALEFQETMTTCSGTIISIANMWKSMDEKSRDEWNSSKDNPYFFESKGSIKNPYDDGSDPEPKTYEVWDVWSRESDIAVTMGGVYIKETKDDMYLFAKIFLLDKVEGFYWYQSMDNAGAAGDLWFCKCDTNFVAFTRNTLIITNEEKFIGGYHPQYKDYGKRGPEFMQEVESDSYRDAMGDIIGDVDYDGQPQAKNRKGYWTDFNGDYVVDEITTGTEVAIAEDSSRKSAGAPTTISFRQSNTTVDGETGQFKKPKTVNCAVHSNDPYDLMEKFSINTGTGGKREGRPMLEDGYDSDPYWAPPNIHNRWALPTMRMASYCPDCDYYISWRFHDMLCPWCGTRLKRIEGDKGVGMDQGSTWPAGASVLKKFFKLNAIGKVQVWAPPGTCVPKDGYYWKNPSVVTNTLIRQIKYRLGEFKDNAWQANTMSAAAEFSIGYPEQIGYFKPMPDYISKEMDEREVYADIKWTGVSKEDRSRYASYNDISPIAPIPGFSSDSSNEAVIVPYTDATDDGLKMITANEIIALRNRIQPVLAYCSDIPSQNDFPRMRASYDAREKRDVPRYIFRASCRVPSMILAANDSGVDSHVQFWSGDYEWGTVREYYPPGLSWWWLNNLIGGKYSDLTGGEWHMDGESRFSGGNRVVSKCAMFIHGILPLDKEVLAAYAIISPAGEPSKDPIGRGWNGHIHYYHYHALTQKHYGDGAGQHLHGQAGFDTGFDEEGNYIYSSEEQTPAPENLSPIVPQDESDYYSWIPYSNRTIPYISLMKSNFDDWTSLARVRDEGFWKQFGAAKVNTNNSSDPIYSYNVDLSKGLKYNSRLSSSTKSSMKFKLIGIDNNGDIRQNYSSDDIWQNMTQDDMQNEIDKSIVDVTFSASDGNRENDVKYSITQYTDKFISSTLPEQMQAIPGYFDLTGINAEKRLTETIDMQTKDSGGSWNKPVIIQAESSTPSNYSGSNAQNQAGIIDRVFDITSLFKTHYNNRIDRRYYCRAGKTLAEVSSTKFEPPRWEGMGNWEKQKDAEKWNSQQTDGSFVGYWLNDDYSFPKLETDRAVPGLPSEGEQYQLASGKIQILCTFLLPFTVKDNANKYWVSTNGEESEIGSLPTGNRITTAAAAVDLLKQIFGGGYTYTITSESTCLIEKTSSNSSDTLDIKECSNSCYGYFSIPTGTISGLMDRVSSVTSYMSGYYPSGLALGRGWVTNSYLFEMQTAVFDLCRAPLEESERDYRYQAGTINCASCVCPNESCITQGKTAGIYASIKGLTFGDGQTGCPACGTDLSEQPGAVKKNGDGIYSWYYQEKFYDDPFVTGVEISVDEGTSFRVSCRHSDAKVWSPILNVVYDEFTKRYIYYSNGNEVTSSTLPTKFAINTDLRRRARYIQIEIDPKKGVENLNYDVVMVDEYTAKASGNYQSMGLFDWGGLECSVEFSDGSIEKKILSTVDLNSERTEINFYFQSSFGAKTPSKINVKPNRFTSRVNRFRVYGYHYKTSELTMTGPESEKFFLFSVKKSAYNLDEFPTQILSVSIGKNGSGGIILKEANERSALSYVLSKTTVSVLNSKGSYDNKEVYVIKSGNYFFEPKYNRIYLPTTGVTPEGNTIDLKDFENAIEGIKENISYYPTRMSIKYWTGSGEPLTLDAQSEYQGPSFQVEKDTITTIETELPSNGTSAKMPDMNGNIARRPIPWVCYNHVAATLSYDMQVLAGGYFFNPNLKSTTLGTTVDNDKFFVDQFGPNLRYVRGTCKTQVTFYGAPNQVISGTVWVSAPAYTTKVINTGSGSITMRERTGGIKDGCLIFKMVTEECKGRKTLAWNKPTIVVYAKDRNPTDQF